MLHFDVTSYVSAGNSRCSASTSGMACSNSIEEIGSPNVMCCAPAATCCEYPQAPPRPTDDAETPFVSGTIGQCATNACSRGSLPYIHCAMLAIRQHQVRVRTQRRQSRAVRLYGNADAPPKHLCPKDESAAQPIGLPGAPQDPPALASNSPPINCSHRRSAATISCGKRACRPIGHNAPWGECGG